MGCNCGKGKRAKRQKEQHEELRKGETETVPAATLKTRRNICRDCPFATKNNQAKYKKFGGLTSISICKRSKRLLSSALKDPTYECPDGRFDAMNKGKGR